ncbi:hypothetical protein DY000_02029691 [Brassica cretica]|uniref:Uncharacterized protein n=1 Tax=Brassica cretica TaxID=69181 RepID=A0ABQ7DG42_BRACR|nr:hypothetical protein DY000_02029691 [Brassica cretica]
MFTSLPSLSLTSTWLAKMRDIILPSHGKKEYQVQVLMDGNLLKLEAKIQVEFTKVRFEDH